MVSSSLRSRRPFAARSAMSTVSDRVCEYVVTKSNGGGLEQPSLM